MKRKYWILSAAMLICVLFAVLSALPFGNVPEAPPAESSSVSLSESSTPEPELNLPLYDGEFQTLANGDSFYTPDPCHVTSDEGYTVLYYNNMLLAFTVTDLPADELTALAYSVGGEPVGTVSGAIHAVQIRVEDSSLPELESLAEKLIESQSVLYACAEYPVQIMNTESDKNPWGTERGEDILGDESNPGGNDWWAEAIGAYTAWEYSDLCTEVRIGIADNGFSAIHEDLKGQIKFITNDENNTAAEHGTLVAGIIGALNNEVGIRGIADTATLYCADLWPLESEDSYHTMTEYLAAVNYMAQSGVCVINNSWGCFLPSENSWAENLYGENNGTHTEEYRQWLESRFDRDLIPTAEYGIVLISQLISSGYGNIIMVQAAGNGFDNGGDGAYAGYLGFFSRITEEVYNNMPSSVLEKLIENGITYHDIDERILIVGAVLNERDPSGNYYMTSFSNYGKTVDICAPGREIFSTAAFESGDGYTAAGGTSLSAPMVTGSVAFLWSLEPELTVSEVRGLLLNSAPFRAIGTGSSEGWDYPMLNIGASVKALLEE